MSIIDSKGVLLIFAANTRKYTGKEPAYDVTQASGEYRVKVGVPGIGISVIVKDTQKNRAMKQAAQFACIELAKQGKLQIAEKHRKYLIMENLETQPGSYETEQSARWSFHPGIYHVYRMIFGNSEFEWYSIRKLYCSEFYTRISKSTHITIDPASTVRVAIREDRMEYLDATRISQLLGIRAQFYDFASFIIGCPVPIAELIVPVRDIEPISVDLSATDWRQYEGRICRIGKVVTVMSEISQNMRTETPRYEYIESSLYKICIRLSSIRDDSAIPPCEVFPLVANDVEISAYLLYTVSHVHAQGEFWIRTCSLRQNLGLDIDDAIFALALTPNTNEIGRQSNQRMEFLGDAILEVLIRNRMSASRNSDKERLVCNDYLSDLGRKLFGDLHQANHYYADAVEALIAAIFIDYRFRTGSIAKALDRVDKFIGSIYAKEADLIAGHSCTNFEWLGRGVAYFATALHLYDTLSYHEGILSIRRHLLLAIADTKCGPEFYVAIAGRYANGDLDGCINIASDLARFEMPSLEKIKLLIMIENSAIDSAREALNKKLELGLKYERSGTRHYVPHLLAKITEESARELLDVALIS